MPKVPPNRADVEPAVDRHFATTLARGLDILRCFSADDPVLGNKDIASRTGLSKPTVSRFTYTLTQLGYLRSDSRYGKYELGSAVLSLGYPLLATMALRQLARPAMNELAQQIGGSVSMGIRDRLDFVYVETSRGPATIATELSDVGMAHPLAATAIGRAYLAACEPAEREALLQQLKVKRPEQWERFREPILRGVEDFRRHGFCVSYGDLRAEIYAVGVPLRRRARRDIVAFNCVVPAYLLRRGQLEEEVGPRLAAMVASISRSHG